MVGIYCSRIQIHWFQDVKLLNDGDHLPLSTGSESPHHSHETLRVSLPPNSGEQMEFYPTRPPETPPGYPFIAFSLPMQKSPCCQHTRRSSNTCKRARAHTQTHALLQCPTCKVPTRAHVCIAAPPTSTLAFQEAYALTETLSSSFYSATLKDRRKLLTLARVPSLPCILLFQKEPVKALLPVLMKHRKGPGVLAPAVNPEERLVWPL